MDKIMLLEHRPEVRRKFRRKLSNEPVDVIFDCASYKEAASFLSHTKVDFVIVSINIKNIDLFFIINSFLNDFPEMPVILMSRAIDLPFPHRFLKSGASGFITTETDATEIMTVFRKLKEGKRSFCSTLAQKIAENEIPGSEPSILDSFSKREFLVLIQYSQGAAVKTISELIGTSPKTVHTYLFRIRKKLNARSSDELLMLGKSYGFC